MTPSNTPFTAVYAQWLESFRAMIPGHAPAPAAAPTPKREEAAANEEWEDEGGSLKPQKDQDQPVLAPVPKIPF